jgi:DNA-binding beta-propeller fold protein YncE
MKPFNVVKGIVLSAVMTLAGAAQAATFVYVSNAEDGNIGMYTLQPDGTLQPGPRFEAGKVVMPMSVSPDKRFLYAAVRSKPFTVVTYSIDRKTGALKQLSTAPLAESFPYISIDKTGRYLLGASYGGHLVSVNAVGRDGKVSEPIQTIPTARNAHAIITDKTNRYVFVPHLGTDQILQFRLENWQADGEHAASGADEGADRPAPHHHVARQQVRLPTERAGGDGDDAVARREDGALDRSQLGLGAAGRQQARAGRAARRGRRAGTGAARHLERHLGLGPTRHAGRQVPVRRGAHQ